MRSLRLLWYERDPDGTRTWGCSWLMLLALVAVAVAVAMLR